MIQKSRLPRMIQRGVDQTLTMELYADDGETEITPTVVSVAVYAGSTLVATLTGTAAVESTATLPAATTDGLELSEEWLEVWSVTVAGVVHQVQRSASLVRRVLHPTVTVRDLLDRHPNLRDIVHDMGASLRAAWSDLQRELMKRGNRPQLILEPTALHEPLLYRALYIAFVDAEQATGDGRYTALASRYRDAYTRSLAEVSFRYDSDEDGTSGDPERDATPSTLWGSMSPTGLGLTW